MGCGPTFWRPSWMMQQYNFAKNHSRVTGSSISTIWYMTWPHSCKIKFDLYLTPGATPIFGPRVTIWTILEDIMATIVLIKFHQNPTVGTWGDVVRRICPTFPWRPSCISQQLHFQKFIKCFIYVQCVKWLETIGIAVSEQKTLLCCSLSDGVWANLLAAILDDATIQFCQKSFQSDRLVNMYDLIYDMTTFG